MLVQTLSYQDFFIDQLQYHIVMVFVEINMANFWIPKLPKPSLMYIIRHQTYDIRVFRALILLLLHSISIHLSPL